MGCAFVVDEPGFGDAVDGVGEGGCVVGHERLEISWSWSRATTARIEVCWNHFLSDARVVVQFSAHFRLGILAGGARFFAAFYDEFEALVQLVLNLFAILEVLFGIVL